MAAVYHGDEVVATGRAVGVAVDTGVGVVCSGMGTAVVNAHAPKMQALITNNNSDFMVYVTRGHRGTEAR